MQQRIDRWKAEVMKREQDLAHAKELIRNAEIELERSLPQPQGTLNTNADDIETIETIDDVARAARLERVLNMLDMQLQPERLEPHPPPARENFVELTPSVCIGELLTDERVQVVLRELVTSRSMADGRFQRETEHVNEP